jgi:hypothetical protein
MSVEPQGLAAYELRHLQTGAFLYRTTATAEEVLRANDNLRQKDVPSRFYLEGDFNIPALHGAPPDR